MSVLVESEDANTKKVTPCRNRNVFSSLFRTLTKNILAQEAEYLDSEISVSKAGKGTKYKEPLPEHIAWVGCSSVEFSKSPDAGQATLSAWDLRLQEALGSCSQGSHMPDARLYSPARLQQLSKNACNSKYFSLNRSVFATLASLEHFQTAPLPSAPFVPNLWIVLQLWHTGTHTGDKENTLGWGYYPKLQGHKKWMQMIRSDLDPPMMFNRSWLTGSAGKW